MKPKDIRKKMDKLSQLIKNAEVEMKAIRKKCKHEDYDVGYYQWGGPGHYRVDKICKYCWESLGTPSEEERKEFEEKEKRKEEIALKKYKESLSKTT